MTGKKFILLAVIAAVLAVLGYAYNLGLLGPGVDNLANYLPGKSFLKNSPSPIQPGETSDREGQGTGEEGQPEGDTSGGSGRSGAAPRDSGENTILGREQQAGVSAIEQKYRPQFSALKNEYDARINNLAAAGMAEYNSYKQSGKNPPVMQLVKKYLGAGQALEAECDQKFNLLLATMEQDLKAADLPLNIIKNAKDEYNAQKAARKKQLIQNGLKFAGI